MQRTIHEFMVGPGWSSFNVAVTHDVERQQEILKWCQELDGNNGLFFIKVWSVSGMNVHIREPNHAFLFKLRWK